MEEEPKATMATERVTPVPAALTDKDHSSDDLNEDVDFIQENVQARVAKPLVSASICCSEYKTS